MLYENYHIVDIDEYTGDFDDVFFNTGSDSNSEVVKVEDSKAGVSDLGGEKNSARVEVVPEIKESTIKSQVIYESNKSTKPEEYRNSRNKIERNIEIEDEFINQGSINEGTYQRTVSTDGEEIKYEVQNIYKGKEDRNYKKKVYFSEEMAKFYKMKPNTFIGTSLGIIFALSTLTIGFWKTFFLFLIIAIANIIGQVLDNNTRILMFFDLLIGKFRNNRFR